MLQPAGGRFGKGEGCWALAPPIYLPRRWALGVVVKLLLSLGVLFSAGRACAHMCVYVCRVGVRHCCVQDQIFHLREADVPAEALSAQQDWQEQRMILEG